MFALACLGTNGRGYREVILEEGAVGPLIEVLRSGGEYAKANAAWLLGSLAADSSFCRRLVASMGAIPPLIAIRIQGGEDSRRNAEFAIRQIRKSFVNFGGH